MLYHNLIKEQIAFYRRGDAGCRFASVAAQNPSKYGWQLRILPSTSSLNALEDEVIRGIDTSEVSTLSLLLPSVKTAKSLVEMVFWLSKSPYIAIEQNELVDGARCLGLRISVTSKLKSWVSGFGPFQFLPKTRQAPTVELTFRTKPRPDYQWVMKDSPAGVVHLADMDMQGIGRGPFEKLWDESKRHTARVLGHKPNLQSAAKTTFAIPENLVQEFNPLVSYA